MRPGRFTGAVPSNWLWGWLPNRHPQRNTRFLSSHDGVIDVLAQVVASKPGVLIYMSQWDMPRFERTLFDNAARLHSARFIQLLSRGMRWNDPDVAQHISLYTFFAGPGSRGCKNFLHLHLDDGVRIFSREEWWPDVAIVQISPTDSGGYVTLGPDAGLSYNAVKNARVRIGIQNMDLPRFARGKVEFGPEFYDYGCAFEESEFDYIIQVHETLADRVQHPLSAKEDAMARAIAKLIPNGAVLQAGIGNPDDILLPGYYTGHDGLRVFAELVGPNAWELAKQQSGKRVFAAFVAGPRPFLKDLDRDAHGEQLAILPAEMMVNTQFIVSHCGGKLYSLAGALAVDARGAVASAGVGPKMFSGIGGAERYASAAEATGGMSIIVMPSTFVDKDGIVRSRVMSTFPCGTQSTLSVRTVSLICTDQGITDNLHLMTDPVRMMAIVGLCAPEFRDRLVHDIRHEYGIQVDQNEAAAMVAFDRLY